MYVIFTHVRSFTWHGDQIFTMIQFSIPTIGFYKLFCCGQGFQNLGDIARRRLEKRFSSNKVGEGEIKKRWVGAHLPVRVK